MAKAKAKRPEPVLKIPVKFGNVSIGKKTARVSCTTARGKDGITLAVADKNLVDCRLTGIILSRCGDAQSNQDSIPGMDGNDIEIEAMFDVKKVSFDHDDIRFGLTFNKKGVDKNDLSMISATNGELVIHTIEEIPDEEKGDDDDEDEEGEE